VGRPPTIEFNYMLHRIPADSHDSHCNANKKITNNAKRVRGAYGNDPKEED